MLRHIFGILLFLFNLEARVAAPDMYQETFSGLNPKASIIVLDIDGTIFQQKNTGVLPQELLQQLSGDVSAIANFLASEKEVVDRDLIALLRHVIEEGIVYFFCTSSIAGKFGHIPSFHDVRVNDIVEIVGTNPAEQWRNIKIPLKFDEPLEYRAVQSDDECSVFIGGILYTIYNEKGLVIKGFLDSLPELVSQLTQENNSPFVQNLRSVVELIGAERYGELQIIMVDDSKSAIGSVATMCHKAGIKFTAIHHTKQRDFFVTYSDQGIADKQIRVLQNGRLASVIGWPPAVSIGDWNPVSRTSINRASIALRKCLSEESIVLATSSAASRRKRLVEI
ncbi:MAG: hypothetical protein LBT03_03215 [Holosporales bacterium]|jgi:hypothetical protein|nr:hypothetical protein [Holosporales bacterium]